MSCLSKRLQHIDLSQSKWAWQMTLPKDLCFFLPTPLSRPSPPAAAKPAVAMPMSLVPAVLGRRSFREIMVHCAASTPCLAWTERSKHQAGVVPQWGSTEDQVLCKQDAAPSSDACDNEKDSAGNCLEHGVPDGSVSIVSQEQRSASQSPCEAQITSFYTKVEEWASGKDTFHGHWIRTVHAKHLAEEISYQLFIEGMPFGVGSGAVRLFTLPQPVKMLWSGTPPDVRDKWKKKEHAGELSKETAFGKIVEAAGTLKSCDFGGVLTFWEATSSSFLNTDREKPVLVLVNKTEAAIKSTSLWRAEVPALARNPPEGNLRLVTWQMPCLDLVRLLERRIKEVVGPNVGSKRRWVERKGKMTCESVGEKKAATTYPPPFLMKEDLLQHGFTAEELKGLGFSASWMKDRRFLANETMEVGYSAKELKAFGVHHIKETKRNWLKEYSAKEFKEAGWSAKDLAAGGYNIWELHQGGYPADEMIKDGFSLQDLRVAGYSVKELRNFSALDLRKVGFTAKELGSGFPWWRLWSDGLPEKDLQGVRNSKGKKIPKQLFEKFQAARSAAFGPSYVREMLQQLKDGYGFTAKELKQADFTLKQLKQAGFSGKQLQTAGFTRKALMSAGFEREKLVGARSRP